MNDEKQEVYAGLGHLFYSIAASDGHVAPVEAKRLKELVKAQWMPLEPQRDGVGSDLAFYIEIGFDHAQAAKMKPDAAFERFRNVFQQAPTAFDASTRQLITRTARSIADAMAGHNKPEKLMIGQLEKLFQ